MNRSKCFFILTVMVFVNLFLFGQQVNPNRLIPANSEVYDLLYTIFNEQCMTLNADFAPCSAREIEFYLKKIDYENLSENSKELYNEVLDIINEKPLTVNFGSIETGVNLIFYPELLYKSNSSIDWTYGAEKNGSYEKNIYKDGDINPVQKEIVDYKYYDAANYNGNKLTKPLLGIPLYVDFSNYAYMECTPFVNKGVMAMVKNSNSSNIPMRIEEIEFMQPTNAYFSAGCLFDDKVGIDFQIGKEGQQIGRSLLGSVIYNNTFQSEAYLKLDLYSQNFKYDLNVSQVNYNKFLYLHNVEFNPWNWLKINFTEGTLINSAFELRFLNPVMIMHSFHPATEYLTDAERNTYWVARNCACLGFGFDLIPFRNFRLYGLYSQVEIQIPSELESAHGRHLPNSFAFQLGEEYKIPVKGGWFFMNSEFMYSLPFMYFKGGEDWSMVKKRYDDYSIYWNPIYTWLGNPYGPDTVYFNAKTGFESKNWNVDIGYMFKAHGENSFNLFLKNAEVDGKTIWAYYPNTKVYGEYLFDESIARNMGLSGNVEFSNSFIINGSYKINNKLSVDGQFVYTFVFNNNNVLGQFEQGIQVAAALKYCLF